MPLSPARICGVQSWSYREVKSNVEVAKRIRAHGADTIELCGVHADFNKPETFAEAIAPYTAAGVKIVSIGVQTFTGEAAKERQWFEFAKLAGATHISAHFQVANFAKAVPVAMALAEEFNINVGIHCHGGYMFGGSEDVIDHLLALGGKRLGLNIDTGWCLQNGRSNPVAWTKKYQGRIFGVHYKDFTWDAKGHEQEVVMGQGALDLTGFVHGLEATGFTGWTVIEHESDPANPDPGIAARLKALAAVPARSAQSAG